MSVYKVMNDRKFEDLRAKRRAKNSKNQYEVGRWGSPIFQIPGLDPQTGAAAKPKRGHRSGFLTCPGHGIIVRGPALKTVAPLLASWAIALPTDEPESLFLKPAYYPGESQNHVQMYSNMGVYVQGELAEALMAADNTEGVVFKEVTR